LSVNSEKKIKVYNEQEHLEKATEETKELYERVKNAILNLDNIEVKPKKFYIAFVVGTNNIQIQKNGLKLWLNLKKDNLTIQKEFQEMFLQ